MGNQDLSIGLDLVAIAVATVVIAGITWVAWLIRQRDERDRLRESEDDYPYFD